MSTARPPRRRPPRRARPRPAPPCSKPSFDLGRVRAVLERERRTSSISSSVSPGKRLTATTALSPNSRTIPRWRARFAAPRLDRLGAAVGIAAVVLERLDRRDEHDRARPQVAGAADDVEELLHAHVGAEAALGDDVVAELERDAVGDERVVAVRDVRERPAVDERRLALERLHEVRLDRLLEQHGHRAGRPAAARRSRARPRRSCRR